VAIGYAIDAVELGEKRCQPPPPVLLTQARLAARNGVSLETILHRYFAGHSVIVDFIVEEAERDGAISAARLPVLLRSQGVLFDRLLAAISEEHARERTSRPAGGEEQRAERVQRLLAGENIDVAELGYDLEAHHVAVIACGKDATKMLRELAGALDRRLLSIQGEDQTTWAWFGGRRALDPAELKRLALSASTEISVAVGEPVFGLAGWRLSHRQARATLPIAQAGPEPVVRYADVALLASVFPNKLLVTSLRELYLVPLDQAQRGKVLRETLCTYFQAEESVSSTAILLNVKRHTVADRLRTIEELLERSLNTCATELKLALTLDEMTPQSSRPL
jgi:GGDEF-like domain/PucR C-terminal helix-turn-helix domain